MALNPLSTPSSFHPSTHTIGCCERFILLLQHIKNFALRFFQWLFCCPSTTPKPFSNAQEHKETEETKKTSQAAGHSLEESYSSTSSSVAPSSTSSNPKDARLFITELLQCFSTLQEAQVIKTTSNIEELFAHIINALAQPKDQLFLLQKLIPGNTKKPFINNFQFVALRLSPELTQLIKLELEKVEEGEKISFSRGAHSTAWLKDELHPVLEKLITSSDLVDPVDPDKHFLQEMLFYICSPALSTKPKPNAYLAPDHLQLFSSLEKQLQARILTSLITISAFIEQAELTAHFNLDYSLFNSLWQIIRLASPTTLPNELVKNNVHHNIGIADFLKELEKGEENLKA